MSEPSHPSANWFNRLLKAPFRWALAWPHIRNRVIYEIKASHFSALNLCIPLTHEFNCPLRQSDAFYSFTEIFVASEYGHFLETNPLPVRWLDLGCHAGYFSLYVAWQHAVRNSGADYKALLVDADPRSEEWVNSVIQLNKLKDRFQYRNGAISKKSGIIQFALRSGMGSSSDLDAPETSEVQSVPVLGADELKRLLPPPYDLVKLDVEGAEFDFLEAYRDIYLQARSLVIEWHSWDEAGSGEEHLLNLVVGQGFRLEQVLKPKTTCVVEGRSLSAGIHLYRRNG